MCFSHSLSFAHMHMWVGTVSVGQCPWNGPWNWQWPPNRTSAYKLCILLLNLHKINLNTEVAAKMPQSRRGNKRTKRRAKQIKTQSGVARTTDKCIICNSRHTHTHWLLFLLLGSATKMKLKTNSVTSCTVRKLELKKKDERERRNARVKAVAWQNIRVCCRLRKRPAGWTSQDRLSQQSTSSSSDASASPNTQRTSALTPAPTLALPLLLFLSLRLTAFYCEWFLK